MRDNIVGADVTYRDNAKPKRVRRVNWLGLVARLSLVSVLIFVVWWFVWGWREMCDVSNYQWYEDAQVSQYVGTGWAQFSIFVSSCLAIFTTMIGLARVIESGILVKVLAAMRRPILEEIDL